MTTAIDRTAVVRRHRPRVRRILPAAPLAVGNGEFCFTADVTGLQTFPGAYPLPDRYGEGTGTLLATMSQWGWHSIPATADEGAGLESTTRIYPTFHGPARYVDLGGTLTANVQQGQSATERWLRGNPHRLDLGRIGLLIDGRRPLVDGLTDVDQLLDLENGILLSRFRHEGRGFTVRTAVHPERDEVAIEIEAEPGDRIGVTLAFPYGSAAWGDAADWGQPQAHRTTVRADGGGWLIDRELDETRYTVSVTAPGGSLSQAEPHLVLLQGSATRLRCDLRFSQKFPSTGETAWDDGDTFSASATSWQAFWAGGAAIDLSDSQQADDAHELERRIVLSQYLTRIHGSGSMPPAETGLTANSWRGKFHLEMHWWHAAHFASWGRPELLERSLAWYEQIAPAARDTARRQGLPGVRWPKQVGPSGAETPSDIGPFLVWQQPHPIHLAELVRRARAGRSNGRDEERAALERWAGLVFETATFMAALPEPTAAGFELGPPLVPAQESYAGQRRELRNPTFELAYWSWALDVANVWRRRLGLPVEQRWHAVARGMVPAPVHRQVFAAVGTPPFTVRTDHPSMLGALGLVPPTHVVERTTMERTLLDILADWDWDSAWGWDFPLMAMTATRVGRPDLATRALLMPKPKNQYLENGHNRQDDTLPIYLPGNGGLLSAVALMARGWDETAADPPGFGPGWTVRHEGFVRCP